MNAANQSVMEQIHAEVARATAKFPTWPTDPLHALAVLGEEFGELTKAMLQLTYEPHKTTADEVRMEAVQTAAMAVRLAMSLGAYEYRRSAQHEQQEKGAATAQDTCIFPACQHNGCTCPSGDANQLRFMTDEVHELHTNLCGDEPFVGCPDAWHEKPMARIRWLTERGDPDVGMPDTSGFVLDGNQCGTVLADLAGIGGDDQARVAMEVLAERRRQFKIEPWSTAHDDVENNLGDLARAAGCYALADRPSARAQAWPWAAKWWKPKDKRSNYVRAAALLLAEIERLDRASPAGTASPKGERGSPGESHG